MSAHRVRTSDSWQAQHAGSVHSTIGWGMTPTGALHSAGMGASRILAGVGLSERTEASQ